jgi:hypothetical protein
MEDNQTLDFTDLDISQFVDEDTSTIDKKLLRHHLRGKDIMFMGLMCVYEDVLCETGYCKILIRVYVNSVRFIISREFNF